MTNQTFEVANIKCQGCAKTLTKELEKINIHVESINLNIMPRKITVTINDDFDIKKFAAILKKIGYPLVDEKLSTLESLSTKAKSFVSCAIGKIN